ncbi:MAG TPA: cyclic 2,3-diphosphoglycerate synthase [Blastocatellia bacterium]|nr:cyclic 2,3-diphosphoglycerate synthase [Blastocatellia bacterium]
MILGAAGRDFHNFNTVFRNDAGSNVVAFTATQIPNIDGRRYPADLAGELYPEGIPIHPEDDLEHLIKDLGVNQVVFAYSDVSHEYVMHLASRSLAAGADFRLIGPDASMVKSTKPVVSVCAVRTGAGKSPTSRKVAKTLIDMGKRVVAIRHPMPYGDLVRQAVQRFETIDDLRANDCTIEEMEEYEPHIANGVIIYAGVDYERILRAAETEADVIVWDGGNNDFPFYVSDLEIVVADPHRPGHELQYYPGEANFRRADVIIIGKQGSATAEGIAAVRASAAAINPGATIVDADMRITVEDPAAIAGKRVLVVEDGPTLTHGNMTYGAGVIAARTYGAAEIIDPRGSVVGEIAETFRKYPAIGKLLPAMGYGQQQMDDLAATINGIDCDLVLIATPIDLRRVIDIAKPSMRVGYELAEIGEPTMQQILTVFLEEHA